MEPAPKNDIIVEGLDHRIEEPKRAHGSAGSVIAILLIVFLLVVGAFYVWGQRLSEQRAYEAVPAVGS